MKYNAKRAQAALDFIMSYGVAILIITLSLYIVFQLGIFNPSIQISECTPSVGFACNSYAIFSNGTLYTILSQDTGTTLNITGAACSTSVNSITSGSNYNGPEYGNVNILSQKKLPYYYSGTSMLNGISAYSGNVFTLTINCYGPIGIANGSLGQTFVGYLWLNYTSSGVPNSIHYVNRVMSFTTKYT